MKCCKCDKSIDIEKHQIPPQWFGQYECSKLIKVICSECIKKAKNNWVEK
jgi:hypothetical protein